MRDTTTITTPTQYRPTSADTDGSHCAAVGTTTGGITDACMVDVCQWLLARLCAVCYEDVAVFMID